MSSFLDDLWKRYLKRVRKGITYNECFSVLQSLQKNKTPGNDGLTVEFYLAFWPLIGKSLVDYMNHIYEFGELSTTQKQALVTLIEKKGKDKRLIKNWRPISLIKGFAIHNSRKPERFC